MHETPLSVRKPNLGDIAGATKPDRNRAIDLYRVLAMFAVAVGHWLAIAVGQDASGELVSGNALEFVPAMHWVTWLLQVMPLFFVVGGFSSAMSLDSFTRRHGDGARPQDWVASRLRRMLSPVMVLAGVWLVVLVVGTLLGAGPLVAAGAAAAAIPLWFLSNYTIDTVLAPYVLPAFRDRPVLVSAVLAGVFTAFELLRFVDIGVVGQVRHVNWVIGWLIFQVVGFAWKDGLLPSGRKLVLTAAVLWALAIGAVTLGPWSTSMVHFPGVGTSPTHPPSLGLMLFGAAYSVTAIYLSPTVSAFLTRRAAIWKGVVAANTVAMSVYLWHMTAAVVVVAGAYALGALGEMTADTVGTFSWWAAKVPHVIASSIVLSGIVSRVAGIERRALLADKTPWQPTGAGVGGVGSLTAVAAGTSVALKVWSSGSAPAIVTATAALLLLWRYAIRARPDSGANTSSE